MTETQYRQVTEALVNFITRVGNGKTAFIDEVMQLPEVVRVLMDFDARTPKAKAVPNIAFITSPDINDSHSFSDLKAENKDQSKYDDVMLFFDNEEAKVRFKIMMQEQKKILREILRLTIKVITKNGLAEDNWHETIAKELDGIYWELFNNCINANILLRLFGKHREVEVQINTGKEEKKD